MLNIRIKEYSTVVKPLTRSCSNKKYHADYFRKKYFISMKLLHVGGNAFIFLKMPRNGLGVSHVHVFYHWSTTCWLE